MYKFINAIKEKLKRSIGVPSMYSSLENLKKVGFNPTHIVDVGAYKGEWTLRVSKIFPNADFLMIEALDKQKPVLEEVKRQNNKFDYVIALLGANKGEEVYFSEIETASSVLEEWVTKQHRTKKVLRTLNEIVCEKNIKKVDLIKLDVQGYELEVLKGFDKYLNSLDVILSEVSLLDIHKNVPLIKDVLNFMYQYGFVVFDICSITGRRPFDKALWQTDLIFVKENSSFRNDKRYQ